MRFFLIYGSSEEFEITKECQIGRREGDLKFSDEHLSGLHAKLFVEDGKLFVMDLGSTNGTSINEKRINKHQPYEVHDEDKIEMGTQLLEVKTKEASSFKIEATFLEGRPNLNPDEATRIESWADDSLNSKTPIEAELDLTALDEATHIEIPYTPRSTEFSNESQTQIESQIPKERAYHQLAPNEDLVTERPHPQPIKDIQETKERLSLKETILCRSRAIHETLGTRQLIALGIICAGLLGFLIHGSLKFDSNSKTKDVSKRSAEKHEAAKKAIPNPVEKKLPLSPPPEAVAYSSEALSSEENNNKLLAQTDSTDVASSPNLQAPEESSLNSRPSLEQSESESRQKKEVKKRFKAATQASFSKAKPSLRDPYSEVALMTALTKIKNEAKRTKSLRVKEALEVDARELVLKHYKKIKDSLQSRWKNSRNLASADKLHLKKTLQSQYLAISKREKDVQSRIRAYVFGKLSTPF